ncbi:hypothetical protein E3P81_01675 [Wallemia ichthyophaga]|nr:hypothetical protein E3P97_01676 [Wallemia ichthyophaga]TIB33436.1 hypothetical protein E3P85_01328 [Wallemia ichthyophaga]TIB47472.1 hypothetical protein E3P82_01674 [Wallemia ichthyophaga]TIB51814.1 hypothetical protein E3P81_01675 [Wallemia ichthyophaga]TIB54554.1 hypothetical protein E3P80_01675 [Wallemia ichthyophaga]
MNRNSIASVSHSYLSLIVLRILAANGFNRSSQQSIESLTHVLECFLLNLAQSAADYAHIGRRSDVSTHDAASAVHDALGDNYLDSLHDIIDDSPRLHLNKSPWEIECQKALSDPEFVGYNLRPRAVRYDYDRVPEFPTASLTRSSSDMDIEDDNDLFGQSEQQQEAVEVEKEIDSEETFDVDDATLIPPKKRFKDDAQLVPAGFPDLPTQNPLEDLPDAEDIHATPQLPKARQQDVTQDIYDPYLNPIPYNQSQLSSLHPYTPLTAENSKEGADSVSEADFLALLLNAHSSAAQIPQLNKSSGKNVQRERVGTLLSAVTLSDFSAADSLYGMFPAAGLKTQATAPAPSHYQSNKEKESMDNYADKLRPVAALPSSAVAANALFKARSPLAALARVLPSDFNRRVTRMKHPEALHDPAHKHKFTYGRPHSVPGKEKDEKGHLIYTWDHKLKDWGKS